MARTRPLLGAVLVVAGLAVVGYGFAVEPHPGQPWWSYAVDEAEPPSDREVLNYSDLAATDRQVFDRALDAPDGTYRVHGERPDKRFRYGGQQYVRYQGQVYRLSVNASDGLQQGLSAVVFAAIAGLGASIAAIGVVVWRRDLNGTRQILAAAGVASTLLVLAYGLATLGYPLL